MREEGLYASVISQAWEDAFHPGKNLLCAGRHQDRQDAKLFLLASQGPWAQSREDICHAAGVDPDGLRDKAVAANGNG